MICVRRSASLFDVAQAMPADPILGLMAQYAADPRADRIDLGVGVWRDADGHTPIMAAVQLAEQLRQRLERSKSYLGMAGDPGFNAAIERLLLGDPANAPDCVTRTVQTPGGTAALRIAGELIRKLRPQATVWLGDPTWANHHAVFRAADLHVRTYPHVDAQQQLHWSAMLAALDDARPGDVVVLHGSCHNPSGIDPDPEQWRALADLLHERQLLPLIDLAYLGFAEGVDADGAAVRLFADTLDELIVCSSCSKNFALYRERTGACTLIGRQRGAIERATSQLLSIVRNLYSMPPAHGAALVRLIAGSDELSTLWRDELEQMRLRLVAMRCALATAARRHGLDLDYLTAQHGMFSLLGVDADGVRRLREQHAVYLVDSGRINVAGLNDGNVGRFAAALADVLGPPTARRAACG